LKNINRDFSKEFRTLKVMPVYIEYRKIEDPIMNVDSKSKCTYKFDDRVVGYIVNNNHYEIRKIIPINYEGRNKAGYFWEEVEDPLE
jgi:hypothetical protein